MSVGDAQRHNEIAAGRPSCRRLGHPTTGIRWWDVPTGQEYQPLSLSYAPNHFAISPDGQQLATAGREFTPDHSWVDVWAYPSLQPIRKITCEDWCKVAYSQDGKWLAALDEKKLQVVKTATGETKSLQADKDRFVTFAFAFLDGGNKIAVRYMFPSSSKVRILAIPSLTELAWAPSYMEKFVSSPGGGMIAEGDWGVRLWDVDAMIANKKDMPPAP